MDEIETLVECMSAFGFSPYETRAYCALLQKSPMNGHGVSRASGIPPSKIYETLQRLHQKGAVLIFHSETTLYSPVPYRDLLARLREHTEETFQAVEKRLGQLGKERDDNLTWSLTGAENIIDVMARSIARSTQRIFAALWDQELVVLAEALRQAHRRGVELQIAIYGTFPLGVPYTYDLTLCGKSAQERLNGRRLSVLVSDNEETAVAELTGSGHDQGIWTHNSVVALLATEYVKEEIMGRSLISVLGEERYQLLRRENPALAAMLRFEP
ncbi:TrmB family transcriptional regulator [Ktedonosporobacter rubrisoli]|uniref:TrmB family transcriptional regulator n=1 Tax=Ktedonosporobacter rubrisoli TaxID=2509675 RepID=A0A4P6JKT5_KTERU|nr:TrmB family transcriptional regulator [Ktedonosporobacter rubrisoli]QBD75610.1 TrmB family transcriptional regulator [Ktedonosporobacter rubrisoli]